MSKKKKDEKKEVERENNARILSLSGNILRSVNVTRPRPHDSVSRRRRTLVNLVGGEGFGQAKGGPSSSDGVVALAPFT